MNKHGNPGLAKSAAVASLALAGALPLAAQAQAASEAWQFDATIYGWFPSIGGSTSFPAGNGGPSLDVSARQVIDALKFAFMGSFEAKRGQWGLWTDLVYADFGADKSGTRDFSVGQQNLPVGVTADLGLDIKSWIWTVAGTYSLAAEPAGTLDLLAGARLLDMDQRLRWTFSGNTNGQPLLPRTGSATVSLSNWDAVVGVKGRANLGNDGRWFIPYYLDVGGGESKLTWQIIAGVGYQFGWGSLLATWRYLDYNFKSSSKVDSIDFNGIALGATFKF